MTKYSTKFKIKIVQEYLNKEGGYKYLAAKYGISDHSVVRRWVNSFKSQGYEGLKISRKINSYSFEFKKNVVKLYLTGEMSYQSLANELKISNPAIITRWVNDFRKQGIEGLKPKKRGRPSKMPKSTNKSKDIKIDSSEKLTNLEDNSLTQAQLKEKIKKLE